MGRAARNGFALAFIPRQPGVVIRLQITGSANVLAMVSYANSIPSEVSIFRATEGPYDPLRPPRQPLSSSSQRMELHVSLQGLPWPVGRYSSGVLGAEMRCIFLVALRLKVSLHFLQ